MTIITAGTLTPIPTIASVQAVAACSGGAASVVGVLNNVIGTDLIAVAIPMPTGITVSSVNDSQGNRYIQNANSYTSGGNAEIWSARGCVAGTASVTVQFSAAASVCVNISEWSNVWYIAQVDRWSQNTGTSTSATAQTLTPRTAGDLFMAVVSTAASISGPSSGYTALALGATSAAAGRGAAYYVNPYVNAATTSWGVASSHTWGVCQVAFIAGQTGLNPLLQFPEVAVQVSQDQNYQSSFQGIATWTDISSYVESFSSNYGRQHELDRVQAGTTTIVVNNRDGTFNPWNTSSFLYPGGLDPMTPVRIVAAWTGVTSPVSFTYIDAITPNIVDALNVNATLTAYDILKLLSLKYLNGTNYAAAILAGN